MTARPDVPDTTDRTDAIARVLTVYEQAHEESGAEAWPEADDYARALLATDDPAAIAALAASLWERHPDAVLTAGVDAGVLQGEMQLDPFGSARAIRREVTRWREG